MSNTTNYKPIASLKGIEHFTKLQKLDFKNQTKVSAIDVSQNPELTNLDCSGTAISELDVSENPKLAWLYCSDTDIASIDVSANTALKQLSCHETNIAELDVSKNTELTGLSVSDTALTSLNIENNTKLTSVSLKNTKIEYLDASKNPLITRIDCAGTPIYGIVLAENNKFSKAGKLAAGTFDIEVPSGSFKLADFFEKMDVSRVTAISGGTIKNGIVSEYTGEEPVVCKFVAGNNKLGAEVYLELTLNLTVTPSEEDLEINEANFPDEIFRNYVSEKCDSDGNGKLAGAEIAAVTEINISAGSNWMYKGAKDLTGIEYFTALKKLQCAGSKVTALDVTRNTVLEYLQCNGTAITALDVSHNPKLVLLSAYKTGIESLDLSQNTELKKVYLSETKLTQLDTSKNEKLEQLDVNDTQMSYLDVSHNAGLLRLDCKNTPLYGLNVGNNKKLMTINKTDSEINLTVPEASFDLKEYFPSIDASKVKIISGAKLDGSVLSGYAQDMLVVYEYNAGKDKKGKDIILNVTLILDAETSEVPPAVINHIPVITAKDVTLKVGDKFEPMAGVTATDKEDGNLTSKLTYEGKVDTDKTGSYTVTYKVSDKDGATATKIITVTVKVEDKVKAFVSRLYTQLLGREADPEGLESWTEVLKSHKEQGAKVAQGFITSPEFMKRNLSDKEYISVLYRTFLDREADAKGLATWQKVLDDGLSRLHVFKGFAESEEFTEICNDYGIIRGNVVLTAPMDQNEGVTKFIARCYKVCLGRKGDEAGVNAWCNQILTGKNTAKQAAHGFVFSDEFKEKNLSDEEYVKTLYRVFMNREADPDGLDSWVTVLKNGESREHVFNGFADSGEFKKICDSYGIK